MRRLDNDHGGVAVLVAILLIVLFGMSALVLDVGNLYWERRQLQNGADAGALAVADDCARGAVGCVLAVAQGVADGYADANASDAASMVEQLDLDLANSEVTVDLLTEDGGNGNNLLYHWIAPILGFEGSEVRASATAQWGSANSADGFPLAVCSDLWEANRPPAPGTPGPLLDIRYKGTGGDPVDNECLDPAEDNFNPGSKPGNFSWLNTTGGECTTEFDFSGGTYTAGGDTGANLNSDCQSDVDQMIAEIQAHKIDPINNDLPVRILPIYSSVTGTGNNATYELETLGAFEFSGLKTQANQNIVVLSWIEPLCTGSSAAHLCVQGRFTEEITLTGDIDLGFDSDVLSVTLLR